MSELLKDKRILVVVAHPDDEVLGLGGTMHRLTVQYNCTIKALILGEGITSRAKERDVVLWEQELASHKANIKKAAKAIGYQSVRVCDFPDNRFDSVDLLDLIKVIEAEKNDFNPEVIFTHHGGDVNIDHQRTFEAVITSCRPMAHEDVRTIITFETMSGTEWRASSDPRHFVPNLIIEISKEDFSAKTVAIECYEFERRPFPHPRSPEALEVRAKMWGITVGCAMAEAFYIVRTIQKA